MSARPLAEGDLEGVRLLLLDVDGVLTDGRLHIGAGGVVMKSFHVRDGLGIALLHAAGVETGLVSGRAEEFVRQRAEELRIRTVVLGERDKGIAVRRILAERGIDAAATAYLGDDVNDLPAFRAVGFPIAVADAHPDALAAARHVTVARGGHGAVREVADRILGARRFGAWPYREAP